LEGGHNTRLLITQAYGPEVAVSSPAEKYMSEDQKNAFCEKTPDLPDVLAGKKDCDSMEEQDEKCVWVDQIYNPYNAIGQMSLGREIYQQLDGHIDAVGCSVGSGASLWGICKGIREMGLRPDITFGVVPHGSEVYLELDADECDRTKFRYSNTCVEMARAMRLDKWVTEKSLIQLMLEDGYPDLFFRVSSEEAREAANRLCREEGIYCGMSSGANVAVALKIARRIGAGKNVVTTIVDRRDRYLSEVPHEKYVV
jgi:cysteine synthase A